MRPGVVSRCGTADEWTAVSAEPQHVSAAQDVHLGGEPLLSARHVSKRFGPVRAVDDVSLDIYRNEIIGLIGDNGAGKSTFLSLLTGFLQLDGGQFLYKGEPVEITSPRMSRRCLGMEMIYQDLRLAPDLTVWQNLFLGEEHRRLGFVSDRRAMRRRAAEVLQRLNSKVRPGDLVGNLSGGEQQIVAISRALLFERQIILMDEPTAAISAAKVKEVLGLVKHLKELGKTVVIVSHRLEDILAVADRIVVFFQGNIRHVLANERLTTSDLVHLMFGSENHRVPGESTVAARWLTRHGSAGPE
jgi:ABC-type sugar transport system ATPase subunit